MYVYGGTSKRYVRKLDWSIEKVVDEGIHPWSLNLFDPDPKLIECNGEILAFTRLTHFVFAYEVGETVFIGWHDGKRRLCLSGKKVGAATTRFVTLGSLAWEEPELEFDRLTILENQFDLHWKEYLRRIFESDVASPIYKHASLETLNLRNGRLHVPTSRVEDARTMATDIELSFAGETLDKLWSVPVSLPPDLAWIFETLGRFNPVIGGSQLAERLLGIPRKQLGLGLLTSEDQLRFVHEVLKETQATNLKQRKGSLIARWASWSCSFDFEGVRYQLQRAQSFPGTPPSEDVAELSMSKLVLSTDGRRLLGPRVALLDLARRQCRTLVTNTGPAANRTIINKKLTQFQDWNMTVLPDAGSPYHVLDDLHIDPLIPDYLERFRKATCEGKDEESAEVDFRRLARESYQRDMFAWSNFGTWTSRRGANDLSEKERSELATRGPQTALKKGLTPQYMNDVLRQLAETSMDEFRQGRRDVACLSLAEVRKYLILRLSFDHGDNPQMQKWISWLTTGNLEKNRLTKAADALTSAHNHRSDPAPVIENDDDRFTIIIFSDLHLPGVDTESKLKITNVCNAVWRYLRAVKAARKQHHRMLEEDARFVEAIESGPLLSGIAESTDALRFKILASITTHGRVEASRQGQILVESEMRKLVVRLCITAWDYLDDKGKQPNSPSDDALTTMVQSFGFCPHCARQTLEDLIDNPEQVPREIRQVVARFGFKINLEKHQLRAERSSQRTDTASDLVRGKMSAIRRHERGKSSIPRGGKSVGQRFFPRARHA